MVVNKLHKKAVGIDLGIPSDSNIKKREHKKREKCQGLKEKVEKLLEFKGTTLEIFVQKSTILVTDKIASRTSKLLGFW